VKRFLLRRLVLLVPTLWAIVTVSFLLIHLAPGDPFLREKSISPVAKAKLMSEYCLDRPLAVQYLCAGRELLLHAGGSSIKYPGRRVAELIGESFPASFSIGVIALLWAVLVGVAAGVLGAVRHNRAWDHLAMVLAMVGISVPSFVLGPLLALVVGLTWFLLPPAGWGRPSHLILPAFTLGSLYAAYIARFTRAGLLDVIRQDFVRTAVAKGLPGWLVVWRHVLKAGLLPVLSLLGPLAAGLFTGSVVIEKVFAIPGTGSYLVDAATNRDYTVALGVVVFYSAFLLAANLLVDLAYGLLDPRIRYE